MKNTFYSKSTTASLIVCLVFALSSNAQSWQWARSAGGHAQDDKSPMDIWARLCGSSLKWPITLIFCLILSISTYSQSWQWARSAGGHAQGNEDEFTATAVDDSGNVYVAGKFKDLGWFDSLQLNAEGTNFDAFVAKYSCQGKLKWVRRIEGKGYVWIDELILDKNQNPVVAGNFGANYPGDSIKIVDTLFYETSKMFLLQLMKDGSRGWLTIPFDSNVSGHSWSSDFHQLVCLPDNSFLLAAGGGGITLPQILFLTAVLWPTLLQMENSFGRKT